MYKRPTILLALALLSFGCTLAFNRSLFFRTSAFWDEPRFERPWLFSGDFQLVGGSNYIGRNGCGNQTNILGIYGPENVQALSRALGIPLELPGNPHSICFQAVADVLEADFNVYQNMCKGFFFHFHFPAILIQLYPSCYKESFCDKKGCEKCIPKHYQPSWQKALESFRKFLKHADLAICPQRQAAASDSTLFFGWAHSFENTEYLDFVDVTIKGGVLFPTGKREDPSKVFDIPFGYNGHWGIPFSADISWGIFDWLTWGLHVDTLFFFKRKQCIRMKGPQEALTGFVTLGMGQANVKPGAVWRTGAYIKADHFYNGLSFIIAGAFEQQNHYHIQPCDTKKFSPAAVNADPRFLSWSRALFQVIAEYDFATEKCWYAPRVAIEYNRELAGKRVFSIHTYGGYLGLDAAWCF